MKVLRALASAVVFSFCIAVGGPASAQNRPEQLGFSGPKLERLSSFFKAEVSAGNVPGFVMLVQRRGQPAYFEMFGVRDAATNAPMTADTLFRIYSMTKPITSFAALMLVEEGKLSLGDPVSKYIPAFANTKVGVEKAGEDGKPVLDLVPAARPMTVQDLLRHTSGVTYSFAGRGLVHQQYGALRFERSRISNEEFADKVAGLPLSRQPGTTWEYSHSTDVLGRVIEVIEGKPLLAVFKERLFDPLGMKDTTFYVTDPAKHALVAEPLPNDGGAGESALFNPRIAMKWESGGGGLVSTVGDYARFAQMIVNGGTLDGKRYLSPNLFAWMVSDHVGPSTGIVKTAGYLPGPGFGFGLGFGVRTEQGASASPGSVGELNWGGAGGTYFWADPKEEMFVVMMMQSPTHRVRVRNTIKNLVYGALDKLN
jgi:CubicO group peptidase (beta-lactamase class C family)